MRKRSSFLSKDILLILQVQFIFKSSKKSNNGTDVNAGQIPEILYRIVTQVREW